tara:strand:- start:957 stop:1871 length:915 start_codon:yes stop_codon:yes gene_type:complete
MNKKSIVFMGTPYFAVESLKRLFESGYNIVGVITAIDKKRGRGRKIQFSPIKEFALENNLKIFQPPNLKDEKFISSIKKLNADLFVVVAFRMLPEILINIPPLGCINLHSSLLPNYRGAAPINWVIINGEKETGLTTFFINSKIDEGNIIEKERVSIDNGENAGSLHDKLMNKGSKLVLTTVKKIFDGNYKSLVQKLDGNEKKAPKIDKNTCNINLNQSSQEILNLINGLSPYPCAKIITNGKQYKIIKAKTLRGINMDNTGLFIYLDKIILKNNKGELLEILEIQKEGKKIMKSTEFLRGNKI